MGGDGVASLCNSAVSTVPYVPAFIVACRCVTYVHDRHTNARNCIYQTRDGVSVMLGLNIYYNRSLRRQEGCDIRDAVEAELVPLRARVAGAPTDNVVEDAAAPVRKDTRPRGRRGRMERREEVVPIAVSSIGRPRPRPCHLQWCFALVLLIDIGAAA